MNFEDQFEDDSKTVSEYTRAIKGVLEKGIPPAWVRGEISNFRKQASGHLYFSLKDSGSQLPAVMFRGNATRLGFEVDNGVEVSAFGELSVYEPHGRYQFIIRGMEESGSGRLHRAFEQLKKKLSAEGLFDADRKKTFPSLPLRVAFVTSPSGAAAQDFIRILKRREWGGSLTIIPARVQGREAADEICSGIEFAEKSGLFDLVVIGRGGGSLEDLWCFNEERVARAVAACGLPIVSAVGHEIDFTLSDFAADVRAETPSAAAELLTSAYLEKLERLENAAIDFEEGAEAVLRDRALVLERLLNRLKGSAPFDLVEKCFLRFDDISNRLEAVAESRLSGKGRRLNALGSRFLMNDPSARIELTSSRLDGLKERMNAIVDRELVKRSNSCASLGNSLKMLSPQAILDRGFSVLTGKDGGVLSKMSDLQGETQVKATLSDGSVSLDVRPEN